MNNEDAIRTEQDVEITANGAKVSGIMAIPSKASSVVIFAHGSGSSRFSTRNHYVARKLQERNVGTLLMDLLTPMEAEDRRNVFDIPLLASRLNAAKNWLRANPRTKSLHIGYFGASTGAGAALMAAGQSPQGIFAVVSRGGRPDLAGELLPSVLAPTLLIVGGNDDVVIELNRQALAELTCERQIKIIAGATHLFEEPGTLEQVAEAAADWFVEHAKDLGPQGTSENSGPG